MLKFNHIGSPPCGHASLGIELKMKEPELYEKLIYNNEDKFYQLRLVVNEFKGKQYLHIRKYFLTYLGEYQASKEGVSMEASLSNIFALLDGLMEICSKEESLELIDTYFSNKKLELQTFA